MNFQPNLSSSETSFFSEEGIKISWLNHARIPRRFWTASVAPNDPLAGYIQRLTVNLQEGRGLLLTGPYGVGKTYRACAIAIQALKETRRVMWITSTDLVNSLKPDAPKFEEDMTMEAALRSRDLLVIDDLGNEYKGSGSGFSEQSLVNLLRHRAANMKTTIITTNLEGKDIENNYGEGLRSLLNECCTAMRLTGFDRRKDSEDLAKRRKEAGIPK